MDNKNKLYIIEDDANIMASLTANFRVLGFEINGNAGDMHMESIITDIKLNQPDYIVLDLILPKVDGFKLLHEIKSNDYLNLIPVIIFTDFSESDFKTRSLNIGADYFFVKTDFQIEAFVKKVVNIIKNKNKLART